MKYDMMMIAFKNKRQKSDAKCFSDDWTKNVSKVGVRENLVIETYLAFKCQGHDRWQHSKNIPPVFLKLQLINKIKQ